MATRDLPDGDEFELVGPDDNGGYHHGEIKQWIMLLPLKPNTFRLFCIVRSLWVKGRPPVRRLSKHELRKMVPPPGEKPVAESTLNGMLTELAEWGLLVDDNSTELRRIHDPATGAFTSTPFPRWRISDYPSDWENYSGWRNVFDKLDAIRAGLDHVAPPYLPEATEAAPEAAADREQKSGDGSEQPKPELSTGSGHRRQKSGRGRQKSGDRRQKSGRGRQKSGEPPRSTQPKPDLQEAPQKAPQKVLPPSRAHARQDERGEESPREEERAQAERFLQDLHTGARRWTATTSENTVAELTALVMTCWRGRVSNAELRLLLEADLTTARSIPAVWRTRLTALIVELIPHTTDDGAASSSLLAVCGQCQGRDGDHPRERVVLLNTGDSTSGTTPCPQCNPSAPGYNRQQHLALVMSPPAVEAAAS